MGGLIGVIMTTCAREGAVGDLRASYAEQAIASLSHLCYDGPMRLHFADDGSRRGYRQQLIRWGHASRAWTDVTVSDVQGQGVGRSINLALSILDCDLIFYLQDDWLLLDDLDLTIPAALVQYWPIGMVRTGPIHPGLYARTAYGGPELQYYWLLDKAQGGYVFTFRSWLARRWFFEVYGPLPEGHDLYNTERIYNEHVRDTPGPEIAYAGNVQLTHPWLHIGETGCDGEKR